MKGVINKGIQELVEEKFGKESWLRVKEKAACDEPFFSACDDYPDDMTFALVKAAAELAGKTAEEVLLEFGRFWVPNTGKRSYPAFFNLAGSTPREFLLNMDRIHEQVTRNMANASPPRFSYEEPPDGRLIMHYRSPRGLCPVFKGLIEGVGLLFGQELEVRETACTKRGDPHCIMEVTFP